MESKILYKNLSSEDIEILSNILNKKLLADSYLLYYGAFISDKIIGFIAVADQELKNEIQYLYIFPEFRKLGIEVKLLTFTENDLRTNRNSKSLFFIFDSINHDVDRISNSLIQNGWEIEKNHSHMRISKENILSFIDNHTRQITHKKIGSNIQFINYNELTCHNENSITSLINDLDDFLNPLRKNQVITPELCFFCIKNNDVVGWITAEVRFGYEVKVKSLYLNTEMRKNEFVFLFLGHFIEESCRLVINLRLFSFDFDHNDQNLERLYSKWFRNNSNHKHIYYIAHK